MPLPKAFPACSQKWLLLGPLPEQCTKVAGLEEFLMIRKKMLLP